MHSDLDQADREKVMLDFKSGRIDILVATDIVARGIDIDDISMVVNYDVPREAEDYVHRIGRTARAGTDGKAVTLVGGRDQQRFGIIEDFLGSEVRKETLPEEFGEMPEYRPKAGKRNSGGKPGNNRWKRGKHRNSRGKNNTESKPNDNPGQTGQKTKPSYRKRRHNHKPDAEKSE